MSRSSPRIRGHWSAIENGTHYRRDFSLGEDANRTASRPGAAVLASLRNLANGLYELRKEQKRTNADSLQSNPGASSKPSPASGRSSISEHGSNSTSFSARGGPDQSRRRPVNRLDTTRESAGRRKLLLPRHADSRTGLSKARKAKATRLLPSNQVNQPLFATRHVARYC